LDSFVEEWTLKPEAFTKDIIVVDEGDLLLERTLPKVKTSILPYHMVLLSALAQESWTGIQKLTFSSNPGITSSYIDTSCVFPQERNEALKI
jgi:hypothetical protein